MHKGTGNPADSMNHGDRLFIGEVEKSWGMTPGNNVNLPELKLRPVHQRERHLSLFNNAPCLRGLR